MADLKTTNIYGDAYINNKVGIATNAPATRLQIGQLSPTAATEGIQFGDDPGTRIYRSGAGVLTVSGSLIYPSATVSGTVTFPNTSNAGLTTTDGTALFRLDDIYGNIYLLNSAGGFYVDATSHNFRNASSAVGMTISSVGDVTVTRYVYGTYVSTSDDVSTGNISHIVAKFGDNFHRSATAAKVAAFLNNQTMSIAGNAATATALTSMNISQFTNNSGYLTSAVTSAVAGTGISVSGATGAVTITNSSPNATHTGDVTGATALTIANDAVTTVKILNANVTNAKLANSSLTIGSTAISLGATATTIAGLTSVTSTTFVGALTGNATTATALTSMNISQFTNNSGYLTSAVTSLAGTTNRITVSGATGAVTLNLPQDIHTGASPSFSGLTVTGITMTNLTGAYQNTTVYDSPRTQSATPSRGIRAPASSIQFTDSYAIAPFYTYRSTGDWPVPYGIGWGTGGESSGIFQRYASNGSSFGDMVFYTGNDGSGAFSFRRHTWEGTTYFAAGSGELNTELFRIDWAGKATATSFALPGGFTITDPGSGYAAFSNWVLLGTTGFYSSTNSAHLHPNTGTYGSWKITGTRGGWGGIEFESGTILMANSSESGFYRVGSGWQMWWSGGTGYVHKGNPGGGTQATILDSSNYTSYTPGLGTNNTLTGINTINNTSNTVINNQSGNLGLTMFQATAGTDAYMTFHIGSDYAAYLGLGGAENDLVYGGWSAGNNRHRILHSGNAAYAWNMNQYVRTTDTCSFAGLTVSNTINGSVTGNAATATTLQTGRAINGVSFNGSAAITVDGLNYSVNNVWLRENGDDAQFQMYGNSRTMIYRTDGNTNPHGGGGYAHIFYYGGSADANRMFIINTDGRLWSNYHGWLDAMSITGNAATATTLQTARNINGTSFNGSAAITTATWGTARTLTIGSTGKSVDGSAAITWSLAEIGAAATNQTMFVGTTSVAINRASAGQTLTGVSIDGNAGSADVATYARRVDGATRTSFTVGGNKDNYYPVIFNIGSGATALQYSEFVIERGGYEEPGYTFAGGNTFSTLNIRFSCKSNGWGYGASYENVEMHGYTTQLVANWQQMSEASKLIVWLRGATIYYFWNVVANTTLHDGNSGGTSLTLANAPYYSYTYTSTQTVQTKALYGKYVNSSTGTSGIYVAGNVLAEGLFSGPGTGLTGTASSLSIGGNAATATILQTARNINGTSFNGSAAITTATWGTARTLTIGSTGKSVDGSAAIAWSLAEIGAAATNQTMFIGTTSVAINRASSAITLTGTSIDGNAATATSATSATYLNSSNYIQRIGSSGNYNTDFQNTPAGSVRHQGDDYSQTNCPGGSGWWFVDNYRHSNASNYWGTQVAWGWEDQANKLATRNITNGNFGSWIYYLNSNNYTDYTVTKTGTGASGTWGINITGNAATATTATNVTIANGSVTLAKIENITAYTILGNSNASAAATPAALSVATVATMLSGQTMNINGSSTSISGFGNPTTAASANTIAYRDGNGDLSTRYFFGSYQNSSDDISTGNISHIMAKFGDNYHRSATAAKVAAFITGQTMNINGSSTSCSGNAATATLATKASTLSQGGGNGTGMTFNWSGQSGQPTWLWGSNDGTNIYVWNPSNFNVNYATSAGSATSATTAGSCSGNAATATNVAASGITGQTGMWTSAVRPGPYRLYRNDDNSAYNVQLTWQAHRTNYWSLRGYLNDTFHAECFVVYSGYADSAGSAGALTTGNTYQVANLGINVAASNKLHINGDNANPAIRVDNGAVVLAASVASNGRGFYGWLPISIGGTTKWIQLYNT